MNLSQVNADKTLSIHSNMPVMLLGNLAGCLPLAIVLWSEQYAFSIIAWVGTIYTFTLFRFLHYRSLCLKTATLERIESQQKAYFLFALVSGCIWGSAGIIFFNPEVVMEFTFLMLLLVAMVSGSMTSLSSRPIVYAAFALPAMLPISVMMWLQEEPFYNWLFLGTIVYLLATLSFSRNLYKVIHDSLILKYQNVELVEGLKAQTESANKANQDKSQFLAAASHDLRQPLHAVNLFVETLGAKISEPEHRHDLDKIRQGLDSLGELFNTLLDISQLDADTTHINKVDFQLNEMVQKLIEQFSLEAQGKKLDLNMRDCQQFVYSDPVLLERMLRNLLSNAIRYTETGSIDIFCSHHSSSSLYLHVVDTGLGIPKQDHDTIFNEFYQLDNPERDRSKGLGLGLAIVRRISNLLEHPVQLHSTVGEGTEFIIELDEGEYKELPPLIKDIRSIENKLEGLKVLVIDNEVDILEAMSHLLATWNCQFKGVESTDKALKIIEEGYIPQFVLSDYRMPGTINGAEVVENIRQITGYVPALIITGDTGADVIAEIERKHLITLNKPLKPAQLRLAMTRLLSKKQI